MRGFPGGIADIADAKDDFDAHLLSGETSAGVTGQTGFAAAYRAVGTTPARGAAGAGAGAADGAAAGGAGVTGGGAQAGATVWQRSLHAWREAGIDWQREPGQRPADSDRQRTEPIPVVRATAAADEAGRLAAGRPRAKGAAGARAAAGGSKTARQSKHAAAALAHKPKEAGRPKSQTPAAAPRRGSSPRRRKRALTASVATALVLVVGVAGGIVVARLSARGAGSRPGLVDVRLAARLADADFAPAHAAPSSLVFASLTGVAAAGSTVVAVGSQPGAPYPRPAIVVSGDGGRIWQRPLLRFRGGAVSAGAYPTMVAGGDGRWLALGGAAVWVSATGKVWQAAPGVAPMLPGDKVATLVRTSAGFLAVGGNTRGTGRTAVQSPVLWTSRDGLTWRRRGAAQLGLAAAEGRVAALRWAASARGVTVIGGEVERHSPGHAAARPATAAVWRSADGGATWSPVVLPLSNGATGGLAGLAATGTAFVAIRPGRAPGGGPDAVAYASPDGATWSFTRALSGRGRGPLRVTTVAGSDHGVVAAGTAGPDRVSFVSADGRIWRQRGDLGKALASSLTAVTVGAGGAVVAAGSAHGAPFLLQAWGRAWPVGQSALAAYAASDVTISDLAAGASGQVAAGEAGGVPALWWSAAGVRWSRAAVLMPRSWRGAGAGLASVTRGASGWLAVGRDGRRGGAAVLISRAGIVWRPAPGASVFARPGVSVAQAAAEPSRYVVVGSQVVRGVLTAAAWRSSRLARWQTALVAGRGAGRRVPSQMLGVTAAGSGFVAVGAAGAAPAVWTSADGLSWRLTRMPAPARAASAVLTRVTSMGARVVAVGTASTGARQEPLVAYSGDGGRTWRESVLPAPGGSASVTALTSAGSGFLVAGVSGRPGESDVVLWSSRDGLAWQSAAPQAGLLRGPGVQELTALSAAGGLVTAIGNTETLAGQHLVIWRARAH